MFQYAWWPTGRKEAVDMAYKTTRAFTSNVCTLSFGQFAASKISTRKIAMGVMRNLLPATHCLIVCASELTYRGQFTTSKICARMNTHPPAKQVLSRMQCFPSQQSTNTSRHASLCAPPAVRQPARRRSSGTAASHYHSTHNKNEEWNKRKSRST